MIVESEPDFRMAFRPDVEVLLFTIGVAMAAGLLFGLVPAWQAIRPLGRFSRSRHGGLLVSIQLALCLPLLVGAGLLVRTVYNVQHVDLATLRSVC
jgi:hypothetical protein